MTLNDDTAIQDGPSHFPGTRHSLIAEVSGAEGAQRHRAWEAVVAAYWRPVYKYVRLRWRRNNEDAKDLVQGFFARAMEKDFFAAFDAKKARFRTFLRTCLDGFIANTDKSANAAKRGGGEGILSLNFDAAEAEIQHLDPPAPDASERFFHDEWVRALFTRAVGDLQREYETRGHTQRFDVFANYDLRVDGSAPKTYEEMARDLGLPATTITNWLFSARRDFRNRVMALVSELSANDQEYRDDLRLLLGGAGE